ncbi:Sulfotransferase family protein [Sulfitobacter marinus]|uniref:Sulfotransferase family protein n=1 Tax=Sulfitobacter marinus TaxID=394264 RepID=A0A1I6T9T8_9RHOB|nr:sulfotransferase family 2 domain-containing protein [Sulfitobacter marinus]SFS85962.1 Sulfotransferase family protein [Sulfitobacter marinus]
MKKIIFLHIPKTAGQTVHSELARVVGEDQTSPVRVHNQAPDDGQFPPGYTLYSGHLDWAGLDQFDADCFAFTILRDPFERIASFYFYLLQKSLDTDLDTLNAPENIGLKTIKERMVDDYFFGGDANWQQFIRDHYDNFYCAYFATRKIRGAAQIAHISTREQLALAEKGAAQLDRVYAIESLMALEKDIAQLTGQQISIVDKRVNVGPKSQGSKRWPQLLGQIESDANKQKLADFCATDVELMQRLCTHGVLL